MLKKQNEDTAAKVRVRFLESIAGLADADHKALDAKYLRVEDELSLRKKRPTPEQVRAHIDELKARDRYNTRPIGFARDWFFKPGEEKLINAETARLWEEAGIVEIILEKAA